MCVLAKVLQGHRLHGVQKGKGGEDGYEETDGGRAVRPGKNCLQRAVCWQIPHLGELIHCCILIFN